MAACFSLKMTRSSGSGSGSGTDSSLPSSSSPGERERNVLLPLFAAQKIDAHVLRQPEQPGGKGRVELILLQRPPELQKYLLRQIQRVVGIAAMR